MPNDESVTGQRTLIRRQPAPLHTSRAETFERHYDRCREAGIPATEARRVAGEAADRNHRTWDARNRDR